MQLNDFINQKAAVQDRQKGPNRLVSGFQINRIKITDMRKKENTQKLNDLAKNKGSELMYLVSG